MPGLLGSFPRFAAFCCGPVCKKLNTALRAREWTGPTAAAHFTNTRWSRHQNLYASAAVAGSNRRYAHAPSLRFSFSLSCLTPPRRPPFLTLKLSHHLSRAQESLLEPKGIWTEAHRDPPPDGPVPEPAEGVVADGQTVEGVRIGAAGALEILELDLESRKAKDCLAESFTLDGATFDCVPIPLLLGIPLMFKRLLDVPTEGEDAEELRYETKMYVYKLMTTPGLGLPLTWNQNGSGTKLPPVLACRSDGVPFTQDDWACLCEFHEYLDENYVEKEQLWYINKPEFKKWVGIWTRAMCLKSDKANPYAFAEIAPCFEHRFPIGIQVRANGLKKAELNGRLGTVKRYDEEQLRVGVEFAAPFGLLSLKHTNLEMADGGAERSKMLLAKYERQKAERKERK